ncbi:MAG: NusG domain II-containing protein [Oscillospiraceae bacterium]|nr:NusG domain II-containing protein [Oscillospiraceae bacterium]
MSKDRKKRIYDLALILGLLALAGILFLSLSSGREEGGWAVVRVNGEEVGRYALDEEGEWPLNGGSNILVIREGCAWLRDADCPDKLCVKQGKIHYTGQVITCLPNRLTVTVEGGESDGVDIVVG